MIQMISTNFSRDRHLCFSAQTLVFKTTDTCVYHEKHKCLSNTNIIDCFFSYFDTIDVIG